RIQRIERIDIHEKGADARRTQHMPGFVAVVTGELRGAEGDIAVGVDPDAGIGGSKEGETGGEGEVVGVIVSRPGRTWVSKSQRGAIIRVECGCRRRYGVLMTSGWGETYGLSCQVERIFIRHHQAVIHQDGDVSKILVHGFWP